MELGSTSTIDPQTPLYHDVPYGWVSVGRTKLIDVSVGVLLSHGRDVLHEVLAGYQHLRACPGASSIEVLLTLHVYRVV